MLLPSDFSFSQHNLQDFVDCSYRFLLKYIKKVAWPAIQSEPVLEMEKQIELGLAFHRIIHQFYLGIDPADLEAQCGDVELAIWLRNFLADPKLRDFKFTFPETALTTSLLNFRMIAKFDLISVTRAGDIQILDWKTSRRKPSRLALQQRLQTRLYPFVLCNSLAKLLPDLAFNPSELTMIYWFSDFPSEAEQFKYGEERLEEDKQYLQSLLSKISSFTEEDFLKTPNEKMCRFCVYRSYCERGKEAGNWDDQDSQESSDDLASFSFSDAGEISF
jgi:hypothetical protein